MTGMIEVSNQNILEQVNKNPFIALVSFWTLLHAVAKN